MKWPKDLEMNKFTPIFYADDPNAETLGILNGLGTAGLVVKNNGDYTSVFSSAPMLPSSIVINILDQAGVHLYSRDKDVVYANSKYITVCANSGGGQKRLHLPEKVNLFDAVSGEPLSADVNDYEYEARHKETFMFRVEKV
jgi:hypothetical protein